MLVQEWAGLYDDAGTNYMLRLGSNGTYVKTWSVKGALVGFGTIKHADDSKIILESVSKPCEQKTTTTLIRFHHRGFESLIDADDILSLASDVFYSGMTSLAYQRLARHNFDLRNSSLISIDHSFCKYFPDPKVTNADVLRYELLPPSSVKDGRWRAMYIINVGAADGVFPGMKFHTVYRDGYAHIFAHEIHQFWSVAIADIHADLVPEYDVVSSYQVRAKPR